MDSTASPSTGNGTRGTVFRKKNQSLAQSASDILADENPMTLRQLYYRLISAGCLRNSQTEYKRLGQVMTRLRESKDVPRTWLVDHTRSTLKPSSWSGLAEFAETIREVYRKDFWARQSHHMEIICEKDAIAATIQPPAEDNDVRIRPCRGYASISFAGEIADFWRKIKKPIFAYYLGDFDPSGFDIERDLCEKLARYSGRECCHHGDDAANDTFVWQRLGVIETDFDDHDLIRLPLKRDKQGKPSDKRAAGFIERYGEYCAEVDAIPPTELRRRVEEAINSHIDVEEWNRLITVEQAEQETVDQFAVFLNTKST